MHYLGFEKFDEQIHNRLKVWLTEQAKQRVLPDELFKESERYLLANRTILPGPSVLERLIIHVCSQVHTQLFASLYHQLPIALRNAVTQLLTVPDGAQHSSFYQLKPYFCPNRAEF